MQVVEQHRIHSSNPHIAVIDQAAFITFGNFYNWANYQTWQPYSPARPFPIPGSSIHLTMQIQGKVNRF